MMSESESGLGQQPPSFDAAESVRNPFLVDVKYRLATVESDQSEAAVARREALRQLEAGVALPAIEILEGDYRNALLAEWAESQHGSQSEANSGPRYNDREVEHIGGELKALYVLEMTPQEAERVVIKYLETIHESGASNALETLRGGKPLLAIGFLQDKLKQLEAGSPYKNLFTTKTEEEAVGVIDLDLSIERLEQLIEKMG